MLFRHFTQKIGQIVVNRDRYTAIAIQFTHREIYQILIGDNNKIIIQTTLAY